MAQNGPGDRLTPKEFADKIRKKYNAYHNKDDKELVSRYLEKYPVYKDRINLDALKKKEPTLSDQLGVLPTESTDGSQRQSASKQKRREQLFPLIKGEQPVQTKDGQQINLQGFEGDIEEFERQYSTPENVKNLYNNLKEVGVVSEEGISEEESFNQFKENYFADVQSEEEKAREEMTIENIGGYIAPKDETRPKEAVSSETQRALSKEQLQANREAAEAFEQARQQALEEVDTGQSRAASAGNQFMKSTFHGLAQIPEAIGIASKKLGEVTGTRDDSLEDYVTYKWGNKLKNWAEETFPTNPKYQKEFIASVLPSAAGSLTTIMGAGGMTQIGGRLLTRGASKAAAKNAVDDVLGQVIGGSGMAGGMMMGSQAYEEAIQVGASEDEAFEAFLYNNLIGRAEGLPIANAFKRIDNATGGGLKGMVKAGFKGSGEEMLQEASSGIASNYTAQQIYDTSRNLLDNVVEEAAAGGVLGFFLNSVGTGISQRLQNTEIEKEKSLLSKSLTNIEQAQTKLEQQQQTDDTQEQQRVDSEEQVREEPGRAVPEQEPGEETAPASGVLQTQREEIQQLTPEQQSKNDLLDRVQGFNRRSQQQKQSKEGQRIQQDLIKEATGLGYATRSQGKGKIEITTPEGKKVNKTPFKESIPKPSDEDFEVGRQFIEAEGGISGIGDVNVPHPNFGMRSEEINKARKDVAEGVDSQPARRYLRKVREWQQQGEIEITMGSGNMAAKTNVPFDDYVNYQKEYGQTDQEVSSILEQMSEDEKQSALDLIDQYRDDEGNVDVEGLEKRVQEAFAPGGFDPEVMDLGDAVNETNITDLINEATRQTTTQQTGSGPTTEAGIQEPSGQEPGTQEPEIQEEQLVQEANQKLDQIDEAQNPAELEVGGKKITQVINNLSEDSRQQIIDKYRDKYNKYQNYKQRGQEGTETQGRQPQEQRPQPDDGRTYDQQIKAQKKATKDFLEGSAKMLQRAFPNFNIVVDAKKFNERWNEIGKGDKPKAFFDKDTVYVDPEQASQDTLYHEFAHPWIIAIKNRENILYQKGKMLVKESEYFKEAQEKYPDKSENEQIDEALATGIGEVGAMQAEGKLKKSKFSNWVSRFWNWIKKRLGITKNIDISQITLADFMQIAGDEMLSLSEVTKLSELRLPETATLTLNKINKLKGKREVAQKVLGKTGETISWHYSRIGGETFSDFMQGMQDKTRPIWEAQQAIEKEGNKITDALDVHGLLDISLGKQMYKIEQKHEQLYGKDTGFLGSNSIDKNAFFYNLSQDGLTQADLDFFMMVRHAKERNARVRERTNNARMQELQRLGNEIEQAREEGNQQKLKNYQTKRNDILNNKNEQFKVVDNGSGMTDAQAESFEAELRATGKWETLEKHADKFSKSVNDAFLNELEDAGILSPDRAQMLREGRAEDSEVVFKHYVPLNVGTFQTAKSGQASVGKGSNLVKKIKGTDKFTYEERVSPTNQMFVNYMDAVKTAEHNRIMQSLLDMTRNYPNDNVFEEIKPKYKIETDKYGNEKAIPIETKDSNGNIMKDGENAVTVFENGKPIYISIKQSEIITALSDKKGIKNKALRGFVRTVSTINQFFRAVLTKYNLDFAVPNFIRDIQDAMVNIGIEIDEWKIKKIRRNIAKGVMPSAISIARYEMGYRDSGNSYIEALKEMKEAGGEIAWLHYENAKEVLNKYKNAADRFNKNRNPANLAKDIPKNLFNGIGMVNQMIEMGTRLSIYKAMRDQGISPHQSAKVAKNATVNFNKEGTFNPVMSKLYLFVNSQVEGVTRNVTALYKSKNARRVVMALMVGNIFNRMLWDYLDEDDEIQPLKTSWENKSEVWLFNPFDPQRPLTVPMSYNLRGWVMLSNLAYDVSKKNIYPEEAAKEVGVAMYEQFSPLQGGSVGSAISPFFVKPFVELGDNVDFKGDPIRPTYPYTIPPRKKEQYYPSTPDVYVDASDWMAGLVKIQNRKNGLLETSPENLQYMTEYFLGGAGKMVTNSLKTGQDAIQGNPLDWDQIPIMRRLITEVGGKEWRYKNFVYRVRDEAQNKIISESEKKSFEKYLNRLVKDGVMNKSTASKLKGQFKEGQKNLKGKDKSKPKQTTTKTFY